ncbi:hypothetical protein RHIZ404_220077 [Rhizobium sp. EC-SD404]|nr:hypothetical protein RHIZ404_220077 [Rhizobium sp. EC-SD404]
MHTPFDILRCGEERRLGPLAAGKRAICQTTVVSGRNPSPVLPSSGRRRPSPPQRFQRL